MANIERLPGDRMFVGPICRWGLGVASTILIFSSFGDISTRSKGSYSWSGESSLAALHLRALGFQKLALGIALGALSAAGIKEEEAREEGRKYAEQAAKYREENEARMEALREEDKRNSQKRAKADSADKKAVFPPSIPPAFPPKPNQID